MYIEEIAKLGIAAGEKTEVCRKSPVKYGLRSIQAGVFIVIATMLSQVINATFLTTSPAVGKLIGSIVFSIAIILVVFQGGELFTGNTMTITFGYLLEQCQLRDVLRIWLFNYIGNFIGAAGLSLLFVASGASRPILTEFYNSFFMDKISISPSELILRGILCNFLVCLAVWTGTRMKSESGKIIVIAGIITTFVICGFEHCIANMSTFTIGYLLLDGVSLLTLLQHMFFVTVGNMIGGIFLFALPMYAIRGMK